MLIARSHLSPPRSQAYHRRVGMLSRAPAAGLLLACGPSTSVDDEGAGVELVLGEPVPTEHGVRDLVVLDCDGDGHLDLLHRRPRRQRERRPRPWRWHVRLARV